MSVQEHTRRECGLKWLWLEEDTRLWWMESPSALERKMVGVTAEPVWAWSGGGLKASQLMHVLSRLSYGR